MLKKSDAFATCSDVTSTICSPRTSHGAVVDVLAEADNWLYVRYENKSGYVSAQYLERVSEELPDAEEPVADEPAFTTLMKSDGTTIRLEGAWRVAED